MLKLWYEHLTF